VSRLLVRHGVFSRGPFVGGLGEDVPAAPSAPSSVDLAKLDERTTLILKRLEEDAKNRRIALMIAGVSALFAAVKLGVIAFPHIRSRVGRM